jgi:hypothetical protein
MCKTEHAVCCAAVFGWKFLKHINTIIKGGAVNTTTFSRSMRAAMSGKICLLVPSLVNANIPAFVHVYFLLPCVISVYLHSSCYLCSFFLEQCFPVNGFAAVHKHFKKLNYCF